MVTVQFFFNNEALKHLLERPTFNALLLLKFGYLKAAKNSPGYKFLANFTMYITKI